MSIAVAVLVAGLRPAVDMNNLIGLLGLYSQGQRSEVLLVFETAIDKLKEIEQALEKGTNGKTPA